MSSKPVLSFGVAGVLLWSASAMPANAAPTSPAGGNMETGNMHQQPMPPAADAASRAAVEAVIAAYYAGLEKGDVEAMSSVWEDRGTVIDGFAPFIWSGDGVLRTWWNAARALLGPAGVNTIHTRINGWKRISIQGNRAFAVADATARLTGPALSLRADGLSSFILDQTGGTWRIVSWAWAGGEPVPAGPEDRPATGN